VIDALATANPNTIVVLETGNPVSMPWRDKVKGIVQAWYPGQAGGQAIAEVLTGAVNPSGRLPITFPADLSQMPRPVLPGLGTPYNTPTTIRYDEGAEVGYRWYARRDENPMYPFGHGVSYTTFDYSNLKLTGGETITASFTVANTGERRRRRAAALLHPSAEREADATAWLRTGRTRPWRIPPGDTDGRSSPARAVRRSDKPMAHHGRLTRGPG
jgi:hypothetical protein